jgi:hypothetical protein
MNETTCDKCDKTTPCNESCLKANYLRLVEKYVRTFRGSSVTYENDQGEEVTIQLLPAVAC